jgi:hypothetical protein
MKRWIADVPEGRADQQITDWTAVLAPRFVREGAKYEKGEPSGGGTGMVGIYLDAGKAEVTA